MRDLRNPFRLQAAEHIESDTDFLKLFGPGVLDLLPEVNPFARAQFIRSAPGGGKTSLLKLFTPSILHTLITLREYDDYRELFDRLKQIGAIDQSSIQVIGVMLPCGRLLPDLADLGLTAPRVKRLLFALLDARIMLGALRGALTAKRLRYPDDLARLTISPTNAVKLPELEFPCDGNRARIWAESLERSICNVIDSLGDAEHVGPQGHEALVMLHVLDSDLIRIDSEAPGKRWLVMLDDVQKLTPEQRRALRATILEQRSNTTVWVAERLEALSQEELLASGALPGRDYDDVIMLEEAWRNRPKKFEALAMMIAKRRARFAAEVTAGDAIGSFEAIINGSLDTPNIVKTTQDALKIVYERVKKIGEDSPIYADWIQAGEDLEGSPRDKLIAWRSLEILITRHKLKNQRSFDFALSREELSEPDSKAKGAAELFLAKEHGLPYYFGSSRLASLGSFNVEQYLRLAGDLFEEALANSLLRQIPTISPERQHAILTDAYSGTIKNLPRRARYGRDVMVFLESVGSFCRDVTYLPNAPYAPGPNGVAITMREREELMNPDIMKAKPSYFRFAQMLAAAVSHNLLHVELDRSVKNQQWMILYLNRLVCLNYDLPLNYGSFRERPLHELASWLEKPYRSSKKETML